MKVLGGLAEQGCRAPDPHSTERHHISARRGNEEVQSPHVQPPARAMTQHMGTPCRAVWASGGEDNRAAISDSGGLAYGCHQHSPNTAFVIAHTCFLILVQTAELTYWVVTASLPVKTGGTFSSLVMRRPDFAGHLLLSETKAVRSPGARVTCELEKELGGGGIRKPGLPSSAE